MVKQLVLVTGGSGFVGSYCIIKLLQAGYRVRTTVRSLKREPDVRAVVKAGGAEAGECWIKLMTRADERRCNCLTWSAIAFCTVSCHAVSHTATQRYGASAWHESTRLALCRPLAP